MTDYTEHGAVPVEDAVRPDPPTVDEVLRRHLAEVGDEHTPEGKADESTDNEVSGVVGAVLAAAARTGRVSAAGVSAGVEAAARSMTRRATASALADPRPVADVRDLAAALAERSSVPSLSGATAAALATRVARRAGPLRFLARRTPMWIAAVAIPALYASIARGATELNLVASHLVLRARAAGVEPDPRRLNDAAVRLLTKVGAEDPAAGTLVSRWLGRAARSTLPFASGVRTPDPEGVAEAAGKVPVSELVNSHQP
jgi:hypothetical protein